MKKLIAILLCALMLAAAAACTKPAEKTPASDNTVAPANEQSSGTEAEQPASEDKTDGAGDVTIGESDEIDLDSIAPIAGGWAVAEDPAMTDELRAIFEKALDELVGVDYVPIACLGTQVVAGTNYCFLAKATVVYPDAKPKYVLVYVYEDLAGETQLMNFADMPVIPNEFDGVEPIAEEETLEGGWAYAEDPEITDEIKANLEKAMESLVGAEYMPIANLATQVVAGTNRCLLCKITPVVPNAIPYYALVYVYENLEGGAEILDVLGFDFGALCTYGA